MARNRRMGKKHEKGTSRRRIRSRKVNIEAGEREDGKKSEKQKQNWKK